LATEKDLREEQIFLGNGSDEVIDLLIRLVCTPGLDKALSFSPTYGIYQVACAINDVEMVNIPLNGNLQINRNALDGILEDERLKLVFICSPNNPTGNLMDPQDIEFILTHFRGLVVLDEAYIDFSTSPSWTHRLDEFPNLVILQTFSKAWGLAGARVGMAYAQAELIRYLNTIKPAYNVSQGSQSLVIQALKDKEEFLTNVTQIKEQKRTLTRFLEGLDMVLHIYPSEANFLLIRVADAKAVYTYLTDHGVIVRNRDGQIKGALRISVGTEKENKTLMNLLTQWNET
jgi:histidinol-phosphate aminotransferase